MAAKRGDHLVPVPAPLKRGVGYIRVSKAKKLKSKAHKVKVKKTTDPDSRFQVDKLSPEIQEERIRAEIERRGWEQGPIFSDIDVPSRAWKRRKDWEALAEHLQPGDVVVVVEGTRIARSVKEMSIIYEDYFEANGIELVALNQGWDTTTAMGRAAMQMTWVWAEAESNQLAERLQYAKQKSRKKGHWQGGIPPLGLDYDEQAGYLVLIDDEVPIVQEIFSRVADDDSYVNIAADLDRRGTRGPNKGHLNAASIYRIVRNPVYIACGEWDGDLFKLVGVPPIIERSVWEEVQTKISARTATSKGTPKPKYLLSGMLTCGKCGSTMIRRVRYGRETARNKPGTVDLCCQSAHSPKATGKNCSGVLIRESIAIEFIEGQFLIHLDETRLERAFAEERGRFADKKKVDAVKKLQTALESIQDKQDRLLDAYSEDLIGRAELERKNKKLAANIEALQQQIENAEASLMVGRVRASTLKDLGNIKVDWNLFTVQEKQKVLRLFIKSITVSPGRGLDRIYIEWTE